MRPRVGHVHLKVSDLDRSEAFYRDVLGLATTERLGDAFVFMSFGEEHHDLALQGHPGAPRPHPAALGLYHFAIEVEDEAALGRAVERLEEHGVRYSPVDHGISKALYFSDPDGHGIEVYCDTRHRRGEWSGVTEPLDVTTLR
jgi:catechol 2,3-dioxygenase